MAIRKILTDEDPTLRKISKPVTIFDDKLAELFKDLEDTMKKADGAGISAVQVGILKRMFVITDGKSNILVVNPELLATRGKNKNMIEGCLSVPEKCGLVERPDEVDARYQDVKGNFVTRTFTGFTAKAFCHEYDHLDGILYIDRATKMYSSYEEYFAKCDKEKAKQAKAEKKNKKNKK